MQCPVEVNQTKLHMIRSDMLNYLWNPVSIFQEVTSPAKPLMEKTITLSKVKLNYHSLNTNIYLSCRDCVWEAKNKCNFLIG